jgi:hypothetical protein
MQNWEFLNGLAGQVTKKGNGGAGFLKCWRDLPILLEYLYLSAGISDFTTTCQVQSTAVPGIC